MLKRLRKKMSISHYFLQVPQGKVSLLTSMHPIFFLGVNDMKSVKIKNKPVKIVTNNGVVRQSNGQNIVKKLVLIFERNYSDEINRNPHSKKKTPLIAGCISSKMRPAKIE